jgi:hypothetical protein
MTQFGGFLKSYNNNVYTGEDKFLSFGSGTGKDPDLFIGSGSGNQEQDPEPCLQMFWKVWSGSGPVLVRIRNTAVKHHFPTIKRTPLWEQNLKFSCLELNTVLAIMPFKAEPRTSVGGPTVDLI